MQGTGQILPGGSVDLPILLFLVLMFVVTLMLIGEPLWRSLETHRIAQTILMALVGFHRSIA